ncbi:MAG: hypothetical protein K2G93_07260 [Rikenella sp.]|nr:hypothetical protein [Rikenella sp.]
MKHRIIRKIWISCWAILCGSSVASAQSLRVVVRNEADEALPYAYIYVNGRAMAVTDTLGIGAVPEAKLSLGDTLTVSYVGAESERTVYDRAMQRQGEWSVSLRERYRTLTAAEVVVRADVEALYRRSVEKFWVLYEPHQATARFTIRNGDGLIEGQATATHQPGDTSEMTYLRRGIFWYHLPLSIDEVAGDTAMMTTEAVHGSLHLGFYYPAFALAGAMREGLKNDEGVRFGYLGKREGCRLFRIVYPEVREGEGRYSVQFLVWVGEEERRIRRIEVHSVNLDEEKSWTHIDAAYGLSPINAQTLVFERVEASWPGRSVELRDPEYRKIRPIKQKKPKKRS